MRALVNTGPNRLELCEVPTPTPGPGEVLIRTGAVGICATDLEMLAGWERTGYPSIPGHEWSGIIDAVGPSVDTAWVDQRCVGDNIVAPGVEVGFERPGGYAEFFLTEAARLYHIGDMPFSAATLAEPLAVCLRGLARLGMDDRCCAVVVGDGPIGLLMTATLRRAGVGRVILVGGREPRLALGRLLGAAATVNRHQVADIVTAATAQLPQGGAPNVIEASGSASGIELALSLAAEGGRVLVLGDYGPARANYAWNDLLHRELALIGSNSGTGAWAEAAAWLRVEATSLGRLVTHRYPVARYAEALATVRDRESGAIKVVLEW